MRRLTAFMPTVSLEDESPAATPLLPVDVETPDPGMIEQMFDESDRQQDNILRASRIAATLEDLADNLQDTIATGDVRPSTLISTAIATDHLIEDAGLEVPPALSAENLQEPGARLETATIAMESMRDKVKRIWEAILRGLSKLCDFVDVVYDKLLGEAVVAQRRVKQLQARIKRYRDTNAGPSLPTLDRTAYFPSLFVEKGMVEPKDLDYVTELMIGTIDAQGHVVKQVDVIIELLREGRVSEIEGASVTFQHPMMGMAQGEYRTAYLMPGGAAMRATQLPAGSVTPQALKSYEAEVYFPSDYTPKYSEQTVPVADLEKLEVFCIAMIRQMHQMQRLNKTYTLSRSIKRKFLSDVKRMSTAPVANNGESDETVIYAKALVENLINLTDNPMFSLGRYAMKVTAQLTGYVNDCLQLYGKAPGTAA